MPGKPTVSHACLILHHGNGKAFQSRQLTSLGEANEWLLGVSVKRRVDSLLGKKGLPYYMKFDSMMQFFFTNYDLKSSPCIEEIMPISPPPRATFPSPCNILAQLFTLFQRKYFMNCTITCYKIGFRRLCNVRASGSMQPLCWAILI